MDGYVPLDLTTFCNAGQEFLGAQRRVPVGVQTFHGLPFQIGDREGKAQNCFIAFGPGLQEGPIFLPIGKTARNILVAHQLIDSEIVNNGPLAEPVAEYVFKFEGGETDSVAIRDRFEIGTVPNDRG